MVAVLVREKFPWHLMIVGSFQQNFLDQSLQLGLGFVTGAAWEHGVELIDCFACPLKYLKLNDLILSIHN